MTFRFSRLLLFIFILFAIFSCGKDSSLEFSEQEIIKVPRGFPKISSPEGNEFTKARWEFGKSLFYDSALSKNGKISCASCHNPKLAFSDRVAFSRGDNEAIGSSNSPTLANVAYHPYFTRAGGVSTLEMQVLVPIQEHDELNTNIVDLAIKLKENPKYAAAALECYSRELDPYVIVRAIANFERSIISGNSSYDSYAFQGNKSALTLEQLNGLKLFFSDKTNCSSCHSGFNFSNYAFENNGLYEVYPDSGRMRLTRLETDRARFKVPTLRNVALTGPYMHDGSKQSLTEIIAHYNSGGENHPNKNSLIRPLNLSQKEQSELVAFLESLTDMEFITNKHLLK
jgi:cytochrome c peroxidase